MQDEPEQPTQAELARARAESFASLRLLHPGNRFRLMAGLPLLDQGDWKPDSDEMRERERMTIRAIDADMIRFFDARTQRIWRNLNTPERAPFPKAEKNFSTSEK